jgi:hypothetical protein
MHRAYLKQAKAMWRVNPNDATSILYDDMNILGLDVFYDKPISAKGTPNLRTVIMEKIILEVFLLRTRL